MHTRDKKLLSEAIAIIRNSGFIDKALEFANTEMDKAWEELEEGWKSKVKLDKLRKLTSFIVERDHEVLFQSIFLQS